MDSVHATRYLAEFSLLGRTPVFGAREVQARIVGFVAERPDVLAPDAVTFLMANAVWMYLLPVQGSPILALASQDSIFQRLAEVGAVNADLDVEAIQSFGENTRHLEVMHESLDILLAEAVERRAGADEAISAHQMLRIIDDNWQAVRAWFA